MKVSVRKFDLFHSSIIEFSKVHFYPSVFQQEFIVIKNSKLILTDKKCFTLLGMKLYMKSLRLRDVFKYLNESNTLIQKVPMKASSTKYCT